MKTLFLVSSIGDTDLALATAKLLRKEGHQTLCIPLTKTAEERIDKASSDLSITKVLLSDLLMFEPKLISIERLNKKQLHRMMRYIFTEKISHVYIGVPSQDNIMPFQIAVLIKHIPVLIAYEFMYKPLGHPVFNYVSKLDRPNVHWALPLDTAVKDFAITSDNIHIIGHLSIDNAFKPITIDVPAIKNKLGVEPGQKLAFVSGTTQPKETDSAFLSKVLAVLPQFETIQLRLGVHPGIQEVDAYFDDVIRIYKEHLKDHPSSSQFQIIFSKSILDKLKHPLHHKEDRSLNSLFLDESIHVSGPEAALAADMVLQPVPGNLLNEAATRGMPVCSNEVESYLSKDLFFSNPSVFFNAKPHAQHDNHRSKRKETPESCADAMLRRN
ncbi:MAG: hypothetical protein CK423_09495 [Legionella sp.]|nr:MAG: hypothetical protein CK423_09495 [Legionella sp.]